MKKKKKSTRAKIIKAFGVTEEDIKKVLEMKDEDISDEYKKIFEKLSKEMPSELRKELRAIILKRVGLTEEDLYQILNGKVEDLSPKYRKIYDNLPKELPEE